MFWACFLSFFWAFWGVFFLLFSGDLGVFGYFMDGAIEVLGYVMDGCRGGLRVCLGTGSWELLGAPVVVFMGVFFGTIFMWHESRTPPIGERGVGFVSKNKRHIP